MSDTKYKESDIDANSTVGRRVKTARTLAGLSRQDLEAQYEISSHTLQSWELGRNKLTEKGAQRLVDALAQVGIDCSVDWLLYGIGLGPHPHDATGQAIFLPPNVSRDNIDWDSEKSIQLDIEAFYKNNKNAAVILVSDDAMEPIFRIGDYVAGSQVEEKEFENYLGQNCIVESDEGTFFRRFIKRDNGYALSAINPTTSSVEPVIFCKKIISVAPVCWHRSKVSGT